MSASPASPRRVLAALLALPLLATAALHPGPPLYLQLEVFDDRVDLTMTVEQWTLLPWLGLDPEASYEEEALTDEQRDDLTTRIGTFFAENNRFTVGAQTVVPTVTGVEVIPPFSNGLGGPGLRVTAGLACAEKPERIGVVWERWEGVDGGEGPAIPILFRAEGEFEFSVVKPTEPESVWHTLERAPRDRAAPAALGETLREVYDVPVLSLVVLVAGLVGLGSLRRRRASEPVLWGVAAASLAGVFLLRDVARVPVASPFRPRVTMPSPEQARAMFETLHGNVYSAFAATSEDEIYDLLAISVAPDLLDDLYGEVYESLILRSDGGAVCRVEDVRVLSGTVDLNPELEGDATADEARALEFSVDWSWEVDGLVSHWGHVHRRTNRYRADYTVAHDGASWKIAGVETKEHVRIDDDGELVRMKGFDDSLDDLVPPRRR